MNERRMPIDASPRSYRIRWRRMFVTTPTITARCDWRQI